MEPDADAAAELLAPWLARGPVVVLSGAGISTESGIPDYRGPTGAARRAAPMTYQAFVGDPLARRRYWARSHAGWAALSRARPNDGHRAVAALEHRGTVRGTITQNVDGLHQAAGATRVVDLHGRLDRVVCLGCRAVVPRARVRERLDAANAGWTPSAGRLNPDGDVELAEADLDGFTVVDCETCGGLLKPDVVYVGENVPQPTVDEAYGLLAGAGTLLVLGTSLSVFSGRRFVVRAARDSIPVVVVNQGPTRADDVAELTVDAPLGATLRAVVERSVSEDACLRGRPATGR